LLNVPSPNIIPNPSNDICKHINRLLINMKIIRKSTENDKVNRLNYTKKKLRFHEASLIRMLLASDYGKQF